MSWFRDTLFDLIREGGTLVPVEVYDKRVEACKGCPHFGIVNPLPLISADGCTLCGCPLETKARMFNYFSPTNMGLKLSECSLVEKTGEDRWAKANATLKT
jgi:hypothetical protein